MLLHTIRSEWQTARSAIATVDWPTATSSYDPPDVVTDRTVAKMLDTLEAEILPIRTDFNLSLNALELRAHFNDNAGTATMQIFAARAKDKCVKLIAEVAWTAGTQTNENGRYFATTAVVTPHWNKTIATSDAESGTGIASVLFDTCGYDRFWVGFDTISASDNVTVEYSGF
jgi:hypothetical protein